MAFLLDMAAEFAGDVRELWAEDLDDLEDLENAQDEDEDALVSLSEASGGAVRWAAAPVRGGDSLRADLRAAERALHARGAGLERLDATVAAQGRVAADMRSQAAELRAWSEARAGRRGGCLACF